MKDLISICILNCNWLSRLQKTLKNNIDTLSYEYNDIEFLLLDNWSSDWSIEYVEQFKEVRIIKSEINFWISAWRNLLAKECKWDYILFLDNDIQIDDIYFLDKILDDYKKLKDKNIWVLFPISIMENDDTYCNIWLSFTHTQKYKFEDVRNTWFIQKWWFEWSAFFIRKWIFNKIWWFDEKYPFCMNDSDLSMRLYNMWYTIYCDSNLYTIHHWLDTRTSAQNIWWKYQFYFAAFLRSILKNYNTINMLKWLWISILWIIFKTFKLSIKYCSLLPLKWLIISIWKFFKDLPETLKLRKYYQKIRVVPQDVYLNFK